MKPLPNLPLPKKPEMTSLRMKIAPPPKIEEMKMRTSVLLSLLSLMLSHLLSHECQNVTGRC